MIVSKFISDKELNAFGLELISMFNLTPNKEGQYETAWGIKSVDGVARCVERMYREVAWGTEEQIEEADQYIATPTIKQVWPT